MNLTARTNGLIIERDAGELFIHDVQREKNIYLTPLSAFVWKKCDGRHDTEAIARDLERVVGAAVSRSLITETVERLYTDRLLENH